MSESSAQIESATTSPKECIGKISYTGILYHGDREDPQMPRSLDREVDYTEGFVKQPSKPEVTGNIEGATLGRGLYTTDDQDEAVKYAKTRMDSERKAVVRNLEIENARLWDFRQKGKETRNGDVPIEIAHEWQKYYETHMSEILAWYNSKPKSPIMAKLFEERLQKYKAYLQLFIENLRNGVNEFFPLGVRIGDIYMSLGVANSRSRPMDLRSMLRTQFGDQDFNNPLHGGLWAKFVTEELRCDGIILNEGGEGREFKDSPTFVLYNLKPIKGEITVVVK